MSRLSFNETPVSLAPAFVILLGGCVSICAVGNGIPPFASVAAGLLASAGWVFAGTERSAPGWPPAFVLILALTLAFSSFSLYRLDRTADVPDTVESTAKVLRSREWGKRRALLLDTAHGRFAAYVPPLEAPPDGSRVRIRGAVFDLAGSGGAGGFDEFLYWRARGARKKIILLEYAELEKPGALYRVRSFLRTRAEETLPRRTAGYLLALLLGERNAELTELHKSAGTLHILAVSGFHVAILAGAAGLLFRRGWGKVLVISALVWSYILLAGAPPGGTRAALMLQVWLLSLPLGRPSSAFNGVSLAGVLLLLYEPWYFFDAGWRLSMLAALFLTASGRLRGRLGAAASPLVWLVTAPQSAVLFGGIPLAGLFINILAVPFFALIFPLVCVLSLPALAGAAWGGFAVLAAEGALAVWEWFSMTAARFMPWGVGYTAPLLALSALIFSEAVTGASGFSKIKIAIVSLILPTYLLLSA